MFGAWLSSGLDPDRLTAKLGRLLGQLTGGRASSRDGRDGREKGKESKAMSRMKRLKGGVRGVFEAVDPDAEGTVSQHHMKVTCEKASRFKGLSTHRTEPRWVPTSGTVSYTHLTLPTICSV